MAKRRISKAEILAAPDIVTEEVSTPEWGEGTYVVVRAGTAEQRNEYEEACLKETGKGRKKTREVSLDCIREKLVVRAVVDDEGRPEFTEEDVAALVKKCAAPIQRIFKVAQLLWGIGDDEVEELAKN